MEPTLNNPVHHPSREKEQGFLLVGVIVMVALVLVALSVAAPIIAKDLRREKELEAVHRGQQYTRAIRLYYIKFNSYPSSVKLLEGGKPNERYLRQHYLDPMTGKDDWKLIGVGQAKTTVKGFFGQPLAGLPGAGGGLGSASGMQSGGPSLGSTGDAGSGGPGIGGSGGTSGPGQPGGGQAGNSGGSAFGSSSFGQSGSTGGSAFGSSTPGQSGSTGGGNSPFESGTTGPFVGVGIPKDGVSIITLNEQTDYSSWEFIYDPRIEQLYAKSSLFGGGIASSGGGLGSASGLNGTPGTTGGSIFNNGPSAGSGPGGIGPSGNSPGGSSGPGGGTNPPTSTPQ